MRKKKEVIKKGLMGKGRLEDTGDSERRRQCRSNDELEGEKKRINVRTPSTEK